MRLLLDTHAFLWWASEDPALSATARRQIESPRNDVFVSPVSAWEIVLKAGLGKLTTPSPVDEFIPEQMARNRFDVLPLSITHVLQVSHLPEHHRDPFDRLLVAQAMVEGLSFVTGDQHMSRYDVRVVW